MAPDLQPAKSALLPDAPYAPPENPRLSVLHHDDDILVLAKPSGLLSVPGKSADLADCLERRAVERFPTATMVHRLDRDTSGVQVLALNAKAHRHLGLQFERRKVRKAYVARVWGHVAADAGRIDLPLVCDWPNRPKQMVDHEHGRPAQTDWQVVERGETPDGMPVTRLALTPLTGRSHQLRVHLLSLGHPILGDRLYAHDAAFAAADRLQLHAASLTLHHPADGRICTFEDPCLF
jgi:tRNA pseudouridine32 synthase/23S rRNA pseudouridine746 synthase